MAHMDMDQRPSAVRTVLRLGLIVVLLLIAVAAILWVFKGGSDGKATATINPQPTVPAAGVNTPGCDPGEDTGSGEWELQDLSGEDGKILNSGSNSNADVLAAAKHDPDVLRYHLKGLLTASAVKDAELKGESPDPDLIEAQVEQKLPSVEALRCVDTRMEYWHKLDGILFGAVPSTTTAGDIARDNGLPVDNGNVRLPNDYVAPDGRITTGVDDVPADEKVNRNVLPNGAVVDHRSYCSNQLYPGKPIPKLGKGALTVVKIDDHGNPVPGFRIVLTWDNQAWEQVTNQHGIVRFLDLDPGDYTVAEIQQPGWVAVTAEKVSVHIESDEIDKVVFVNRKEVPSTPTRTSTPPPGSTHTPTATKTPVRTSTPVTPSATPKASPTPPQTPEATPTKPAKCKLICVTPTFEPDYPFPPGSDPTPDDSQPTYTPVPNTEPTPILPTPPPTLPTTVPR